MATQTRTIFQGVAPDGLLVTFQYDFDDVSLLVTAVRCINASAVAAYGEAKLISSPNRLYSRTFAANTTDTIPIPTGPTTRLQLFVNADGKLDGVEWAFRVPA